MENSSSRLVQENRNLNFPSSSSPLNSPHNNNGNNNNNIQTPPLTAIPISRSETNPYPTTFVQADTTTFKQVVQMLTGSSETAKQASSKPPTQHQNHHHHHHHQDAASRSSFSIPPMKTNSPKKQNFKLYERRNSNLKNNLMMINTFLPSSVAAAAAGGFYSPRNAEILSPSLLDFPKLALSSPDTPLKEDPFNKSSPSLGNSSEEDKAIAEKGFYLHPSPMSTPRDTEPQLLPLFPVTSPRVSDSS